MYQDISGRRLLSVTTLKGTEKTEQELTEAIAAEVKHYCGIQQIKHITNFNITKALPDLTHLKMTAEPSESQLTDHIFVAGDILFNGSLNAAMESGRLAADGLIQKKKWNHDVIWIVPSIFRNLDDAKALVFSSEFAQNSKRIA